MERGTEECRNAKKEEFAVTVTNRLIESGEVRPEGQSSINIYKWQWLWNTRNWNLFTIILNHFQRFPYATKNEGTYIISENLVLSKVFPFVK